MRYARPTLISAAILFALLIIVGNWRAHHATQRQLEELSQAIAALPAATGHAAPEHAARVPSEPGPPAILPSGLLQTGGNIPRELEHTTIPAYAIEATDVLVIEALLRNPKTRQTERLPVQPISGEFVVRPDGTLGLGVWGQVAVAGLSAEQAADAVRRKLSVFTQLKGAEARPDSLVVTVDVKSKNSKAYYLFFDGNGGGEQVLRLPWTGNETVLDAIAAVPGLAAQAETRQIRVMRKSSDGAPYQNLTVNWNDIVQRGDTRTNYALQSGDRVYVTAAR